MKQKIMVTSISVFVLFLIGSSFYLGYLEDNRKMKKIEKQKMTDEWVDRCVIENQHLPSPRQVCESKERLERKEARL